MTPLILTVSEENTAQVREMLNAAAPPEETAGFTVGQPDQVPDLLAGHLAAGVDEVIFSFTFADPAAIASVARALGLGAKSSV